MTVRFVMRLIAALGLTAGVLSVSPMTALGGAAMDGTPIMIGYVASQTGSLSSSSVGSQVGAEAFIRAINKQGGYHGHPLELVVQDDESTPAGTQNAINYLLSKGVFAIISNSDFFFTDDRPVQQAGVPVVGGITDGPEWGQQPFTNMFDLRGDVNPSHEGLETPSVPFLKSIKVSDVAGMGLGISPSSRASIEDFKTALQDKSLQMGYENLAIPYGAFDPGPYVLQMKGSGVQAFVCSCATSTFVQFLTAIRSAGLTNIKPLGWAAPDETIFENPTTKAAAQGAYFNDGQFPPLDSVPAMKVEHELHAVDPAYKVGTFPSLFTIESYLGAELIYTGLGLTSSASPTQASFIQHLRTLKSWTADGLLAGPIAFNNFGTTSPNPCQWFVQVKGSNFVFMNHEKPFCAAVPSNL